MVLLAKLHEHLDRIHSFRVDIDAEISWADDGIEKIQRYLEAARYRQRYQNLMNLIRIDDRQFDESLLTLEFLSSRLGRKYLRRASQSLSAQSGMGVTKSATELKKTVAIVRHGALLLQQLEDGHISLFHVEEAAKSILSIELPDGESEDDDSQLQNAVEQARSKHAADLADLAQVHPAEADFRRGARLNRDQQNPIPLQERAKIANAKRNIRFTPMSDQMSKIEIYASSHVAVTLEHLLVTLMKTQRATGLADQRTRNQLLVDTFVDLVTDNQYWQNLVAQGRNSSESTSSDDESNPQFGPGDDGSEGLGINRLPEPLSAQIVLQLTLEEFLKMGGVLDPEVERMTKDIDQDYFDLAVRNRKEEESSLRNRRKRRVDRDVDQAINALGSDHDLSPQAIADLIGLATEMTLIVTEPISGYPLGAGRKSYRADKKLRLLTALRDRHCRVPGCRISVQECESDHTEDWAKFEGCTDYSNLHFLCRNHHQHKSNGWLKVRAMPDLGDGVLEFEDGTDGVKTLSFPEWPLAKPAWKHHRENLEKRQEPPF